MITIGHQYSRLLYLLDNLGIVYSYVKENILLGRRKTRHK
jgi:hypothetical protein